MAFCELTARANSDAMRAVTLNQNNKSMANMEIYKLIQPTSGKTSSLTQKVRDICILRAGPAVAVQLKILIRPSCKHYNFSLG